MVLCEKCEFGIGSKKCHLAFETLRQNKPPLVLDNKVVGCSHGKKKHTQNFVDKQKEKNENKEGM